MNSNGGTEGTLFANLDHCVTNSGRRCLRAWLCRPLARVCDIQARQDAVHLLLEHSDAVVEARGHLKGESVDALYHCMLIGCSNDACY